MSKQLMLFGMDEPTPIPECSKLALEIWGSPERIARLTLEAARRWKAQHPGRDVMEAISPDWRDYVRENL